MNDPLQPGLWRTLGKTLPGAAHVRAGTGNQDYLVLVPVPHQSCDPLVQITPAVFLLVAADGHGSAKCFRSSLGACVAGLIGRQQLLDFAGTFSAQENLSIVKRMAEESLPKQIAREWLTCVTDLLAGTPFTEEELHPLTESNRDLVRGNPVLAYGTTFLAVMVTEKYMLSLQLGDGDILMMDPEGNVSRPLPGDARLFANETTSLCAPEAWRDFRLRFQVMADPPPALILVTTDGYPNSFADDDGFLQVGADLLRMLRADGVDSVAERLPLWLEEASSAGSGDDITVGLLYRTDSLLLNTETEEESGVDA